MATGNYDAVVVGAGPNGLAAAIVLAQAGRSVVVFEAADSIGGGTRTQELTLPGFRHDICSAIHPLGVGSPFLSTLPLEKYGLDWVYPPAELAHPLDDGTAAVLERSVEATGATLGGDAATYRKLMQPLVETWSDMAPALLGPASVPRHPFALARFGLSAIRSATGLAESLFKEPQARALFAGLAGHSQLPLTQSPSAAFGLVLGVVGHVFGWPFPRGGAQAITDAMAGYLRHLGGEIITGHRVETLASLPPARIIMCDIAPRQLLALAGDRLAGWYRWQMRHFRYGPGAFKLDYALDGPIPWTAEGCHRAGTIHLGGRLADIAAAERDVASGRPPTRPYILLAQQSLFDPTRAPAGKQTLWAYCHVPNGSTADMTEAIEAQIERFAPGFRDRVLARHVTSPADYERYNPNYVGGDINAGRQDWLQLFTRPATRLNPYATGIPGLYLCSSSTPPGGGVHGMCGYWAAHAALRADKHNTFSQHKETPL